MKGEILKIYDTLSEVGPGTTREIALSLYGSEERGKVAAVSAYCTDLYRMGLLRRRPHHDPSHAKRGPVPFVYEAVK